MDPVAPMALRLQGNLLYGVSRVYSQQCGYALTDVQAIHDKMRAMLRSVPAGGLDPAAGKIRPDQLILPYDPSFVPENNLPGLGLDLSRLSLPVEGDPSQQSNLFWPQTPDLTQSALASTPNPQLNLPSEDSILRDLGGGFGSGTDIPSSVQKNFDLGGPVASNFPEDGGVLLQPDFEFDEDGNIIELGEQKHSETRAKPCWPTEGQEAEESEINGFPLGDQHMLVDDEDVEMAIGRNPLRPIIHPHTPNPNKTSIFEPEESASPRQVTMGQRQRAPKVVASDDQTALRNSELAYMNNEYIRNMTTVLKQKRRNRAITQAKKNAAYWVFGLGIGSVGTGVGSSRVLHPLCCFSGDELYGCLHLDVTRAGHKRSSDDEDSESIGRRVRAKKGESQGLGDPLGDEAIWHEEDVEIGRDAPATLHDDNSSQMPWNITASIQSSRHESSVANIFRGLGSVSDFSSHGLPDSAGLFGSQLGRARGRLISASPLAGRGFAYDLESMPNLAIPGNEGHDMNCLDLGEYLEADPAVEGNSSAEAGGAATSKSQIDLQNSLTESLMGEESINFLEFLATKINATRNDAGAMGGESDEITFSTLLPPKVTSRKVATHGLMHILALATKGFLSVHQDTYEDRSGEEYGVRYNYGEISLRLSNM